VRVDITPDAMSFLKSRTDAVTVLMEMCAG
jgi:hypothetical protein